jgi:hypothetical protein
MKLLRLIFEEIVSSRNSDYQIIDDEHKSLIHERRRECKGISNRTAFLPRIETHFAN